LWSFAEEGFELRALGVLLRLSPEDGSEALEFSYRELFYHAFSLTRPDLSA